MCGGGSVDYTDVLEQDERAEDGDADDALSTARLN